MCLAYWHWAAVSFSVPLISPTPSLWPLAALRRNVVRDRAKVSMSLGRTELNRSHIHTCKYSGELGGRVGSASNFFFNPHLKTFCFSLFLESEEGREKHWCERGELIGCWTRVCPCPDQVSNLQSRYVPSLGIEPATVQLWDDTPTKSHRPGQCLKLLWLCWIQVPKWSSYLVL